MEFGNSENGSRGLGGSPNLRRSIVLPVGQQKPEVNSECSDALVRCSSVTELDEKTRYKIGRDPELDKKFALYKKVNLFTGKAYHDALSQKEAKVLIKLSRKAEMVPWRLKVLDVLIIVEFYDRIIGWRKKRRKELARIRKERARLKLREAAKEGNADAILKLRLVKKADAAKSANYRKKKRELRKNMRKNNLDVKS